ncbi:MAG TPA: patatin-like phospholipase family protein [Thermoleophilaceae bacterium]
MERVALVLAGGGARGAYEVGALSVLFPALDAQGMRPTIVVGTSVGAVNGAYVASRAHEPVERVTAEGEEIWRELSWEQVVRPLASPGALERLALYLGEIAGIPGAEVPALLDPAPLAGTLAARVSFAQLHRNVADGALDAASVVGTSALTGRSVVFHDGGDPPGHDPVRGIDYVPAALASEHVRASAAIPGLFPAVRVHEPEPAAGWYYDGGTRLNTPIKPALALGADRVVVVALNSIAAAPAELAGPDRPDALEGAAQLIQAVLVDPLVHDVRTLAMVNEMVAGAGREVAGRRRVPYVFVAPRERDAIGRVALRVFRDRFAGATGALRSPNVAALGRLLAGARDPAHGELLSYLFFDGAFADALIELGRLDARRWLDEQHDDGLWQLGQLS